MRWLGLLTKSIRDRGVLTKTSVILRVHTSTLPPSVHDWQHACRTAAPYATTVENIKKNYNT